MAATPYLSFFAGAGGLDVAARIAFPETRCIGYVEIGIEAAEILAARIDEGSLDDAPVWSDVRTFPGRKYRGRVAGIVAGFPCPDYSVAGKRAGIVGKHGQLWDELAGRISEVGPDWVLLENVSGILVPHGSGTGSVLPAGLWFVLGDLASLGFDAEWICLRASDVGASHGRMRWFCLAYRQGRGCGELRQQSGGDGFADRRGEALANATSYIGRCGERGEEAGTGAGGIGRRGPAVGGVNVADTDRKSSDLHRRELTGLPVPSGAGADMGDADQPGLEGRRFDNGGCAGERAAGAAVCDVADSAGARFSYSLPAFAPGPGASGLWADLLVQYPWLRPAISQAEAEPLLRNLDDGLAAVVGVQRTDALRACGNGVVPLQAALAFRILARRTGLKP